MSIQRAKSLMSGLRWHHLGFAFFWATTFAALTNSSDELAAGYEAYSLCKQATVVLTLVASACVFRRRERYTHAYAIAAGVLLATGSLLFYLAFFFGEYSLAAVLVAAASVGCASGGFFVMWQSFYASEGSSRTAIYIPLSAVCSVALCLAVSVLPAIWSVVCSVIVLPGLSALCLCRSLDEIEPYDIKPCTRARVKTLLLDMAKPVFCVSAIGFVWRLTGHLYDAGTSLSFLTLMAGMACATLVVTAIELFSERGFDVLALYRFVFPAITGVFLLPTLFGASWFPVLSGFLMFGFEVVNLLLLITCAVYASRNALNSTVVYAICLGPTLFFLLCGDAAGAALNHGILYDFAFLVDALFVCIYGLSLAVFFASMRKSRKAARIAAHITPGEGSAAKVRAEAIDEKKSASGSEEGLASASGESADSTTPFSVQSERPESHAGVAEEDGAEASEGGVAPVMPALSLEERLALLDTVERLSQRECEVTELLLHGNTVPAIARKLFISENTVRGHTKNIYRKLDVHSKQELIDLLN